MPSIIQAGNAASTGLVTTGHTDGILELRSGTAAGGTVAMTVDAAQNLTGATAGRLFGRSNILGTVSQTAGVPTGAIIERGSNANGQFVRFADGTQICTGAIATLAVPSNGSVSTPTLTFAAAFSGESPARFASGQMDTSADSFGVIEYSSATSLTSFGIRVRNGATAQNYVNGRYSAIGRWF